MKTIWDSGTAQYYCGMWLSSTRWRSALVTFVGWAG